MTILSHEDLVGGVVHPPHRWEFADEEARLAATDFLPTDTKKLALDLDTYKYFILTSISPIAWKTIKEPGMLDTYFGSTYGSVVLSESNLRATINNTWHYADLAGFKESGKWFAEFQNIAGSCWAGVANPDYNAPYGYNRARAIHFVNGYPGVGGFFSGESYVGTQGPLDWPEGSYLGLAYDMATGNLKAYVNGVYKGEYTRSSDRALKITFTLCAMSTWSARVTANKDLVHYPIPSGYTYFGQDPV